MNAPDDNEKILGPLRDIPPEVSMDQVADMVAAFPLATAAITSQFGNLWSRLRGFHLNSIIMTSAGLLLIGTIVHLLSGDAPTPLPSERIDSAPLVIEDTAVLEEPAVVYDGPQAGPASAPLKERTVLEPLAPVQHTMAATPAQPEPKVAEVSVPLSNSDHGAPATERTYDLRGFTAISAKGSVEVLVSQGDFSVKATGPEEALERLALTVEGNTLSISTRPAENEKDKSVDLSNTQVTVRLPDLSRVEALGSGTVNIGDLKRNGPLALSLRGSGDIRFGRAVGLSELAIDVKGSGEIVGQAEVSGRTKVEVLGSGSVRIEGTTKDIDAQVLGSGDLHAEGLSAGEGKVSVTGSGDAYVNCSGPLGKKVTGSGNVHVSGASSGGGQRTTDRRAR